MAVTFKRGKRVASYEEATDIGELLELAKRKGRSLYREERDCWEWRGFDEYMIAAEGRLPYCATPEELVCQLETRDEIMAILALCTEKQRERFLLYALYEYTYEEIGKICGCTKGAVQTSIEAVRKKFQK